MLISVLTVALLGGVAGAWNDFDNMCGTWELQEVIGIQWKWDGQINPGGWWAYAFASVAEPNWDNSISNLELGFSTAAEGEYGVYDAPDGWAGQAWAWCQPPTYVKIIDFLAEGNLNWHGDSSWDPYMGNVAGHEIGHTLGFGHSSVINDAVMRQGYTGAWPTADDYAGWNSMYSP